MELLLRTDTCTVIGAFLYLCEDFAIPTLWEQLELERINIFQCSRKLILALRTFFVIKWFSQASDIIILGIVLFTDVRLS